MIEDLVANMEYRDFSQCPSYRPPKQLPTRHQSLAPIETVASGQTEH